MAEIGDKAAPQDYESWRVNKPPISNGIFEKSGRTIHLLSSYHGNFEYTGLFGGILEREIFPQVDRLFGLEKHKWMFLVEAADITNPSEEVTVVRDKAFRDKIPIFDPIVSFSKPTVNLLAKNLPAGPISFLNESDRAKVIAYSTVSNLGHQIQPTTLGFTEEDIIAGRDLMLKVTLGEEDVQVDQIPVLLKGITTLNDKLFKEHIKVTNYVSFQLLWKILREHPDRKSILLLIGAGHQPIMDMTLDDIPWNYLLNSAQLNHAVEEKNECMRRTEQYLRTRLINALSRSASSK